MAEYNNTEQWEMFSVFGVPLDETTFEEQEKNKKVGVRNCVSVTAYIRHANKLNNKKEKTDNNYTNHYRLLQVTSVVKSSGNKFSWKHNAMIFLIRALGQHFDDWWSKKNTEVKLHGPIDKRTHVLIESVSLNKIPLKGFADFWCRNKLTGKMAVLDLKTSEKENQSVLSIANKRKHIQQLRIYALLARWLFLDDTYTPECYIASVNFSNSSCFQLFRIVFNDDFRTIEQALHVEYNPIAVIKRLNKTK